MEESLLNKIPQMALTDLIYDGWANGKVGSISCNEHKPEYKFYECVEDDSGNYRWKKDNEKNAPLVATGIVWYWLMHRRSNDRLTRLLTKPEQFKQNIREQFESYTNARFIEFRSIHKDEPCTWNWDWDYQFYCLHIIPQEMKLNEQSEALFEYVNESDSNLVRSVMTNYIDYLKDRRAKLGYDVSNELKVLRAIDSKDPYMLEDLNDDELSVILDKLENEGYVHVAWVEGHKCEDARLFAKGKVYLEQLLKKSSIKIDEQKEIDLLRQRVAELELKTQRSNATLEDEIVEELASCFYGNDNDARDFLKQIKTVKADKYKPGIAKTFLNQRKLSPLSAKGELCNILKKHKLYDKTVGNWNQLFKKA